MRKTILRVALLFVAVVSAFGMACAQEMPPIPVDKDVRIGKLPNGLTYYIRHNEKPQGQADFYIAQKVGSILEEENQRGLAHFLEHMCFNGTENFPGSSLRDWLESIGVKFGANLNAYTSIDETVYNISNVPVARTSVQDSVMLILHDWANALTLDPAEIDKERGVIHEEWRRSMVGQMRILENLLPVMYPNNRYGERLPIGTIDVIDNFKPQEIRDYYETWYRPDQQGIIVVGDIDVDYIEGKIKELFSGIEMPANAKERTYLPVEDNQGTIYAIGSDPEQTVAIVDLMFKTDAFPEEMKGDMSYLITNYVTGMIDTMLGQRLSDLGKQPDAPFATASAGYGKFFVSKTKDAFEVEAVAKGADVLPAFEAIYRELLRAQRGGFTVGEYQRAQAEYLSRIEKAYNGRDQRENEEFVGEYVQNFTDNEPIPSIEDYYQIMNQIVPMIPVDAINQLLPQLITNDNRVLLCLMPQKDGYTMPTEEDFAAIVAKVDAENIEPYKDNMKDEPLIPQLPVPGKIVSVEDNAQWGAKIVTLSNGVKVWVKTTDFKKDEILFGAVALGGTSQIPDTKANELIFAPYALSQHGLGGYTNIDLQKYLQGKQVHVSFDMSDYDRTLSGSSTVKDLPTLFELIYMTFIDYNVTEDEYAAMQNRVSGMIANQEADPTYLWQKRFYEVLFESAASRAINTEIVEKANRQEILDMAHGCLANAAEYTFYFVGDVTVDMIAPMLEQYVASLPAIALDAAPKAVINLAREPRAGSSTDISTTKMETPQTWCLILYAADMTYTVENQIMTSIMGQILSNRLINAIREEMGATYSIQAVARMSRNSKYNTLLQIPFPMKPEMKNEVLAKIDELITTMESNVTPEELNPIKEYMVKSATEGLTLNDSWLGAMEGYGENNVDTFNGRVDAINSITVEKLEAFVKAFLAASSHHVVIMDPAE